MSTSLAATLTEIKRRIAIAVTLLPACALAADGDVAYCARLTELMNTYLGGDMGRATINDPDVSIAIDRCQKGDPSAGIPVLERKLRGVGYTLPGRQGGS